MLTDTDLAEIEARLAFYDQEYWVVSEKDNHVVIAINRDYKPMPQVIEGSRFSRDEIARFIAHAPEDIQNLLDEVRHLRAELAEG